MVKQIGILGAGRSVSGLLNYLDKQAKTSQWKVILADSSYETAAKKALGKESIEPKALDIDDVQSLSDFVQASDIVISMLPPHLHAKVATHCLQHRKHLLTASYVSEQMKAFEQEAIDKGLLLLMEMGLDPGIDHMSAMAELDQIRDVGGEVVSFKSFTGGLVAPESDNNPWHYKVTWNPRNVVLAGQGTVKFIRNNRYKYIPYHGLFRRLERVYVKGVGEFDGYANRDSLKYRTYYQLENIPTLFRGTLRYSGFCEAWDVFVQLGMTDDSYFLEGLENMTYRDFVNTYLVYEKRASVEQKLAKHLHLDPDGEVMQKLKWLGVFSNEPLGLKEATPAQILQKLIEQKWRLLPDEKDMIVMQHQIEYSHNNQLKLLKSSMMLKGENAEETSMARTVGLPLGIAAKLLLEGKINLKGVHIPVNKEIYEKVLPELEKEGVRFEREVVNIV